MALSSAYRVIVVLLVLRGIAQSPAKVEANDIISILVDNSVDSQNPPPGGIGPIRPYFTSYSTEWDFLFENVLPPQYYNTSFQLFLNLKYETGSTPWLRIGGDSSDQAWYSSAPATNNFFFFFF